MTDPMDHNKALWDEWTRIHVTADFYDAQSFRDGTRTNRLRPYEIEEIGDVRGKDLVHLQCHFGLDTLSWANLGARVTGVDYSPEAIAEARKLAADAGIDATFVECNVYDTLDHVHDRFDVVYTSRGVLGWLPDLERWAAIAAGLLKPGGIFYVAEIHPIVQVLDETSSEIRLAYPYWGTGEPMAFPVQGSYADPGAHVETDTEYAWNHSLGEIVTAVAGTGLRIESLREYPFLEWSLDFLEERDDGVWALPEGQDGKLPLYFSLKATKPG
jgi:SAM-dependent methyltransferase